MLKILVALLPVPYVDNNNISVVNVNALCVTMHKYNIANLSSIHLNLKCSLLFCSENIRFRIENSNENYFVHKLKIVINNVIRCLGKDKLFPAENPVFCDEKNDDPFYEIQCCRTDLCNKYIHISIAGIGENSNQQQTNKNSSKSHPPHQYYNIHKLYAHQLNG